MLARSSDKHRESLQLVQVGHFDKADPAYGAAVARKLNAHKANGQEAAQRLSVVKEAVEEVHQ